MLDPLNANHKGTLIIVQVHGSRQFVSASCAFYEMIFGKGYLKGRERALDYFHTTLVSNVPRFARAFRGGESARLLQPRFAKAQRGGESSHH